MLVDADRPMLEMLQRFFGGIGRIYSVRGKISRFGATKAANLYRVHKLDELGRVIEHFNEYRLRSANKRAVYEVWRWLVIMKQCGVTDYESFKEPTERLSSLVVRNQPWR